MPSGNWIASGAVPILALPNDCGASSNATASAAAVGFREAEWLTEWLKEKRWAKSAGSRCQRCCRIRRKRESQGC